MNDLETLRFLSAANSKALAVQVIYFRLLGMRKELAKLCMAELERRKNLGDDFNYVKFIDEELNKSPQPKLNKKDQSLLKTLFNLDMSKL